MRCSILLGAVIVLFAGSLRAADIFVAFWNVENLFDTEDDPNVALDEEFTPQSAKQWTEARLQSKLRNLAKVIRMMNDDKGPDILGLCEVENRAVVESLVSKLEPLHRDYKIVHKDSPSDRGIDCALIYDAKAVKLADSRFHFVDADNTRDILEAKLECATNSLYVFVNHWPSRRNPEAQRFTAARTLRQRLDEILSQDANADAIVIGDFNDSPSDPSVKYQLKSSGNRQTLPAGHLFNTSTSLQENGDRGTYVFDNRWELIDQISVSPGMLDSRGFCWKSDSTKIIAFDFQMYHHSNKERIDSPSRSYTSDNFHEYGYSDHLPVSCVIEDTTISTSP